MSVALAAFLRPFIAVLVLALLVYPIKWLVQRYLPEGRLKRFLFISWRT